MSKTSLNLQLTERDRPIVHFIIWTSHKSSRMFHKLLSHVRTKFQVPNYSAIPQKCIILKKKKHRKILFRLLCVALVQKRQSMLKRRRLR